MNTTSHKTTKPFIRFDWELAQREGINVALVLATLIDHYEYFERNKKLVNNEFFNTKEMIGSKTTLKSDAIRKAENRLEELDYIRTRLGQRKMKYYYINFQKINSDNSLETAQSGTGENGLLNSITPETVFDNAQNDMQPRSKRDVIPVKTVCDNAQSGINNTKQSNQRIITKNNNKEIITDKFENPEITHYINCIKSESIISFKHLITLHPELYNNYPLQSYFQSYRDYYKNN